jgi:hypothetical protein
MTIDQLALELEIGRVLNEVVASLLGRSTALPDGGGMADRRLACRVAIHDAQGAVARHIAVVATFGLAERLAGYMFGADLLGAPSAIDAQEALREVSNMVAGNLKPLFGQNYALGLPEDLPSDVQLSGRGQLAEAALKHATGTIEVRVYAQAASAA